MELLMLAGVGFALVVTLGVVALKVIFAIVVIPLKLLGLLAAGGVEILALGLKISVVFMALAALLVVVAALPILVPVAVASGFLMILFC